MSLSQNLTLFRVSENRLSGSFPEVLLSFRRLNVLYMSHNMLSCTLPEFPPEFLKQVRRGTRTPTHTRTHT